MTSRLLLLQIVLFGIALTTAKVGGDLRQQSNLGLVGPASAEDDAKEQGDAIKSDDSSEQKHIKALGTEEVKNTTLSAIKVTDGTSEATDDPDMKLSSTQVLITRADENSTQASSAKTMRRDISESASTTPTKEHSSTDEETVATMRLPTSTEKDELVTATTEASDSEPSTSEILITATMDITQRESSATPRKYSLGSTSAMSSESTSTPAEQSSTEEVNATMVLPSASTGKDELLVVTTKTSELTQSTSQDFSTQSSEKSTSLSVITMRRDVSETVSAMPSTSIITQGTKQALTNEITTATMLPSTATEKGLILDTTTEGSDLKRSTSQVVFSSTEKSTQADPIATVRRDAFEFPTSMQTTTSAARETEYAASKTSTSTKGASSTTTPNKVSSSATSKTTFLENDDPIANTSTTSLSTTDTTPPSIAASVSTISSTSTGTSPIPTILPSTETDHNHSTSTLPSSAVFPESTGKKVPSTTTSARPTTTEPQTCVDARRIGKSRINCSRYRKMCHIEGYKATLKKYCPVTCGYCKLCFDQIRNRRNICTRRAQHTRRMCNHRRSNIRADTRKRCPVTCGVCSEGSILFLR